jgi:hypothetical protein
LTAGTRRNGTSKLGPFHRATPGHTAKLGRGAHAGHSPQAGPPEVWAPDEWTGGDWAGAPEPAGDEWTPSGEWAAPEGWTAHEDWTPQHDEEVHADRHPQPGWAAQDATAAYDVWATRDDLAAVDSRELDSAGPHGHGGKTARKWAGKKVVPAAAAAATLAVGAAAFTLFGTGGGHPQATQLNDAVGVSGTSASAGAGQPNGASSPILKFATAGAPASPKPAGKHAKAPAVKPSSTPTKAAAAPQAAPASAAAATKAAAPSGSSSSSTAKTLSCNLSGGLLPDNVSAIVSFLLAHGYSDNAAAGIAGNIYQESKGNPESVGMGGGGLIGWTPLPSGFVTGNVTADLDTQLAALLTYNQGWHQYIAELDAASSPADAAYIYVTMFERAGIPAASTREAAATDVASACGI